MTVRAARRERRHRRADAARPVLRVGSVRVPVDAAPVGARFGRRWRPERAQTVTLRFSLAGEATPKVVRDRRARILIAGQSVAMRVKVPAVVRGDPPRLPCSILRA